MYAVNDIPVSVGDVISYNFYMYGISDTLLCTITDIGQNYVSLKINNSDEQRIRYGNFQWFYEEWRKLNPLYIFEFETHMAPKVPDINETCINRNLYK